MKFGREKGVKIVLLNLTEVEVGHPNFRSITGDGRDMKEFKNGEFDIVFSNSVIEHLGTYDDQRRMAGEIRRVGKRFFVQTPNRFFPIEPHFLFPFFQFLPLGIKVWLRAHFQLGWYPKVADRERAIRASKEIRLLTRKELMDLFPGATIFEEKFLGLIKSFIVYDGWNEWS